MYFFNLITKINRSGIKKLILDCSHRKHDLSEKDFKDIYELFLSGLSSTNLEKMARIRPGNSQANASFDKLLEDTKGNLNLSFELGCFNNVDSAFAWLRQENLILGNNSNKTTWK